MPSWHYTMLQQVEFLLTSSLTCSTKFFHKIIASHKPNVPTWHLAILLGQVLQVHQQTCSSCKECVIILRTLRCPWQGIDSRTHFAPAYDPDHNDHRISPTFCPRILKPIILCILNMSASHTVVLACRGCALIVKSRLFKEIRPSPTLLLVGFMALLKYFFQFFSTCQFLLCRIQIQQRPHH